MRSLFKIGFGLLLLSFVLIGASYSVLRAQGTAGQSSPGSRLVASDKRTLERAVGAVEVSGPINLTLRQGAEPALEVRGEQRLLANIDTSIDGDTLHIGPRGILLRHRQPIEVLLTLPTLDTCRSTAAARPASAASPASASPSCWAARAACASMAATATSTPPSTAAATWKSTAATATRSAPK
jgi:hypothetical protein